MAHHPDDARHWVAAILTDDGDLDGKVVDISNHTLVVDFPIDKAPNLRLAEIIPLKLKSGATLTVKAKVTCRTERPDAVQYFFVIPGSVRPDIAAVFHGRSAYRVKIESPESITVAVRSSPKGRPFVSDLADISHSGVGLWVTVKNEKSISNQLDVYLAFKLPDIPYKFRFAGTIRRRELKANRIFLGIQLDPDRTADFDKQTELIVTFTRRRQMSQLRLLREAGGEAA